MFGQNDKRTPKECTYLRTFNFLKNRNFCVFFALLPLAFLPIEAEAIVNNFATNSPLGLSFGGGIERNPKFDFVRPPRDPSSEFSKFYAVEPFFDLINFSFRLAIGFHTYPNFSGRGTDATGNFSESGTAGTFDVGAKLLLAPWIARNLTSRGYIAIGAGRSIASIKNLRTYSDGTTNLERGRGTGDKYSMGLGYETFFVQNYSIQFETGYEQSNVNSFKYTTSKDASGTARADGELMLDANNNKKALHRWGPYFSVMINLNL